MPIKWINLIGAKGDLHIKYNFERYERKLQKIDSDKLCQVPAYIGVPIVEKLLYTTQEDLSEGFINLLTKASSTEKIKLAHPSFVHTLSNLSADEAKILFYYKDVETIPFIDIQAKRYKEKIARPDHQDIRGSKSVEQLKEMIHYTFQDKEETLIKLSSDLSAIEEFVKIDFKDCIDIYLINLEKLGLIKFERGAYSKDDIDKFNILENSIYKAKIDEFLKFQNSPEIPNEFKVEILTIRGQIEFTEYGKAFINACMNE